jgi:hypothetical protein
MYVLITVRPAELAVFHLEINIQSAGAKSLTQNPEAKAAVLK